MAKYESVHVSSNEVATVHEAMNVLASMPYRQLIELAGLISADADKIAAALDEYFADDAEQLKAQS